MTTMQSYSLSNGVRLTGEGETGEVVDIERDSVFIKWDDGETTALYRWEIGFLSVVGEGR